MKIRNIGQKNGHIHWCPGCKEIHRIPSEWGFNRDIESPTFTPSVRINWGGMLVDGKEKICHYFITDGKIIYCGDSTHDLAGKTVALEDMPKNFSEQIIPTDKGIII